MKNGVKFTYFKKGSNKPVECLLSKLTHIKLAHDIYLKLDALTDDRKTVYLFAFDSLDPDNDDIFITSCYFDLFRCLDSKFSKKCLRKHFLAVSLHEYSSFEDAYLVALQMRENNRLCYKK